MSAFREAMKTMINGSIRCPKCGELHKEIASMIDREPDGSYFCSVCSTKFWIPKEK